MENLEITRASNKDVVHLAAIRKIGWLTTYVNEESGVTKEDLLTEDFESFERITGWQKSLLNPDVCDYVATYEGVVVGFAVGLKKEGFNKIGGLYVLPEYQKKGVGGALLNKLLEWFGVEKDIKLNVAVHNDNAIRFYEMNGFERVGPVFPTKEDFFPSGRYIPEVEMVKRFN